jgi:hypothetical protein
MASPRRTVPPQCRRRRRQECLTAVVVGREPPPFPRQLCPCRFLCALRSASTGVELCAAATNLLFAAPPAVAGPGTTHDNPNGPWRSAPSRRTPGASSVIARAQAGGTVRRPRWHGLCEQTLSAARVRTPGLTMTLGSWPDGGARKHELRTSRGCAAAPTLGCQSRSQHPRTSEQNVNGRTVWAREAVPPGGWCARASMRATPPNGVPQVGRPTQHPGSPHPHTLASGSLRAAPAAPVGQVRDAAHDHKMKAPSGSV